LLQQGAITRNVGLAVNFAEKAASNEGGAHYGRDALLGQLGHWINDEVKVQEANYTKSRSSTRLVTSRDSFFVSKATTSKKAAV
jgi:hypothetical protein